jgi:ribose 5-phosphate isomerase A
MTNSDKALEFIQDGFVVGLGSGSAATRFVHALAERVKQGLRIRAVPTSKASEELARKLNITLVTLEAGMPIDITVDGADEVDPGLNLIKGYGRAMVREKIVATASKKLVILVGPEKVEEKLVPQLGKRARLPVEVIPFGLPLCSHKLRELDCEPTPYREEGQLFVTDNGNHILDCRTVPISNPANLEERIRAIPGVVGTGLFIGMADVVLIQRGEQLEIRERKRA